MQTTRPRVYFYTREKRNVSKEELGSYFHEGGGWFWGCTEQWYGQHTFMNYQGPFRNMYIKKAFPQFHSPKRMKFQSTFFKILADA